MIKLVFQKVQPGNRGLNGKVSVGGQTSQTAVSLSPKSSCERRGEEKKAK